MNTTTLQELKAHHEQRAEEIRELIRGQLNLVGEGNLAFIEREKLRMHERFADALDKYLSKP